MKNNTNILAENAKQVKKYDSINNKIPYFDWSSARLFLK